MIGDMRWRDLDILHQLQNDKKNMLREAYDTVDGIELNLLDWDDH